MSIQAMMWAKRQRLKPLGGTVAHRAILMVLADYADEGGECFPGQELIGWETEQSVRTIRRHLGDLETWGLFRREARFHIDERTGRSQRTSDRFVLALDMEVADEAGVPTGQVDRRTSVTGGQADRRPDDEGQPANGLRVVPATADRGTDRGTDSREPTESTTRASRTKRTRVPEPFVIGDNLKAWAAEKYPHLEPSWFVAETERFVGYHASKGNLYQDWDRSWQEWMRRAAESVKRPPANRHVDTGQEEVHAKQRAMFEEDTG